MTIDELEDDNKAPVSAQETISGLLLQLNELEDQIQAFERAREARNSTIQDLVVGQVQRLEAEQARNINAQKKNRDELIAYAEDVHANLKVALRKTVEREKTLFIEEMQLEEEILDLEDYIGELNRNIQEERNETDDGLRELKEIQRMERADMSLKLKSIEKDYEGSLEDGEDTENSLILELEEMKAIGQRKTALIVKGDMMTAIVEFQPMVDGVMVVYYNLKINTKDAEDRKQSLDQDTLLAEEAKNAKVINGKENVGMFKRLRTFVVDKVSSLQSKRLSKTGYY